MVLPMWSLGSSRRMVFRCHVTDYCYKTLQGQDEDHNISKDRRDSCFISFVKSNFLEKKQIYLCYMYTIKLYVLVLLIQLQLPWMTIPVFLRVKVCQKWWIIIIPICPSLPSLPGPRSCIIIFQVPGEESKSLYLPLANSSSLKYESCEEYLDPSDHSQGTTVCSQGYDFQFDGENEWTITAEVSKALWLYAVLHM